MRKLGLDFWGWGEGKRRKSKLDFKGGKLNAYSSAQ